MAGPQDFERRRRERLQRQRKQRERARMIRYASLIALFIIVVIIIIVSVTKCAGSDPAETADGNEAVVTQIPAEPTATAETRKSDIPAPKTGDNNDIALWIAAILISGAAMTGTALYSRKKKYSR